MSDTAQRLAAYKATELRILEAQSAGHGDRNVTMADLAEVRRAITALQAKLASENLAAAGSFGPKIMVADFSRGLR